jgi:hypothetical protein
MAHLLIFWLTSTLIDSTASPAKAVAAPQEWMTDYGSAYARAKSDKKLMLIHFYQNAGGGVDRVFEQQTLRDAQVSQLCRDYVLVRLPTTTEIPWKGKQSRLLAHSAFRHMRGQSGVAIIDLKHENQRYYRQTVSCLPFEQSAYYAPAYWSPASMRVLLSLPPGTLTQRTLVYAVRTHPERPASTNGVSHPMLCEACSSHAQHQAAIRLQGHHNWGYRFQRIWQRVGGQPPIEVCAESWPGEDLLQACLSCVHSWRQSPGHWNAVRSSHPAYAYDIRQGGNGIWYATGIFGG